MNEIFHRVFFIWSKTNYFIEVFDMHSSQIIQTIS